MQDADAARSPVPLVSIIALHFQTEILSRLRPCAIRRHTPAPEYEVIVVDNGSGDGGSLDHLRQVDWIRLIERTTDRTEKVGDVHKQALDIGIAQAQGWYLLPFHTGTILLQEDWLQRLVGELEADEVTGAVGSYKLDQRSRAAR